MEEFYPLLNNIAKVTWLFYALSLLMFYYASKGFASKNSDLITLVIIVAFNALMLGYQGILDWYTSVNPGVSPVVHFFWYMGFAGFYLVALIAIFRFHKKENVRIGQLGQYTSFAFFAAGSLQLLQYAEIVLFNTDQYIDKLYTFGIPAINTATGLICFSIALKAAFKTHFKTEKREG